MDLVTFATRVCKVMGVETIIVTNAAGGLNQEYAVGDIVCLNDVTTSTALPTIRPATVEARAGYS